ncbi:FAD:protein FMN transferase [Liquorilactobacillus mali]|uniref:FAD:protein FMN transferase n=1 Tax=Liquorilactobacillus mali TaxID=1618 RepID=UPI00234FEE95|nr:FAD:protein FMN transferase [Liquorilactobacillus mali]MDC7953630.1 FAD:protein FMN transferase [Liquorilactobacillus mali]
MTVVAKTYHGLGTKIVLTVFTPATIKDLDNAYTLIKHYEDLLTVNRAESEIMDINHAAGNHAVKVSPISYQLIKQAVEISQKDLGFDVAIGPLVKLWHIGFSDAHVPAVKDIQARLKLIDPRQIELNDTERSVFLLHAGMELDLGGIAKGYIADAIKQMWLNHGVNQGIINLGGNVVLLGPGPHQDQQWKVGIQDPFDVRNKPLGVLTTKACSVVTSGIYERLLNYNGQKYHHIFDPKTGYPVNTNLASVTVISKKSITGEAWSSIGFYNGINTLKLSSIDDSLGFIFTTQQRQVFVTKNLREQFKIINDNYHFAQK